MSKKQSWNLFHFLNTRDKESLAEKCALDKADSGAHSGLFDSPSGGSSLSVPSFYKDLAVTSAAPAGEEISPSKPSKSKKQKFAPKSPGLSTKAMDQLEAKLDKLLQGQAEAKLKLEDFRKEERDFKMELGAFRKNVEEHLVEHA